MSQENVELVHQANDALNRRDLEALLGLADIEFVPRILELEGGGPYRGHDGVRGWWESFLGVVPDFSTEVEEVQAFGATTVARARLRGHGVGSGATMDQTAWQVAEWREKKCVRWRTFENEADALEAAAVAE